MNQLPSNLALQRTRPAMALPTRNEEAYRSRAVLRRGEEAREDPGDQGRQDRRRAVQGVGRSLCQKHILPWTSHMSYALAPSA